MQDRREDLLDQKKKKARLLGENRVNGRRPYGHGVGWGKGGGAHLPSVIELIVADKVRVVTLECVEKERLVRLWDLVVREPSLVRQVHVGRQRARVQAGRLGVQLEVHGLGRLDAQNELVARDVFEDALRDVLELDPHFHFGLVQG